MFRGVIVVEDKVQQIVRLMAGVADDPSIPRNVRRAVADAKAQLESKEDISVRVSGAVYTIEQVSEDINMPMHARTQIWTILSALERLDAERGK